MNELLSHRGFSLKWYTAETGAIKSTSGYSTHFGINASDLITVYAYDIAKLPAWEQFLWAASNVAPEGKVSERSSLENALETTRENRKQRRLNGVENAEFGVVTLARQRCVSGGRGQKNPNRIRVGILSIGGGMRNRTGVRIQN